VACVAFGGEGELETAGSGEGAVEEVVAVREGEAGGGGYHQRGPLGNGIQ